MWIHTYYILRIYRCTYRIMYTCNNMTYIYAWCMFRSCSISKATNTHRTNGLNLIFTRSPVAAEYATRKLQQKQLWHGKLWCHLLSGIEKHTSENLEKSDMLPRPLDPNEESAVDSMYRYTPEVLSNVVQELKWFTCVWSQRCPDPIGSHWWQFLSCFWLYGCSTSCQIR